MIKIPSLLPDLDVNTRLSISIVFSFAAAVLTYLSIWGLAGRFGDIVGSFLLILLGKGSGFLPLVFVFVGITLYRLQKNTDLTEDINARLIWGIIFAVSAFNGLLNIIFGVELLSEAQNGGGLIGFIIYPRILGYFGTVGAIMIMFSMFFISFFLISQMTVPTFLSTIQATFSKPERFWDLIPDIFEIWKKHAKGDSNQSKPLQDGKNPLEAHKEKKDQTVEFHVHQRENQIGTKKQKFKATSSNDGIIELQVEDESKLNVWKLPPLEVLRTGTSSSDPGNIETNKKIIQETLAHFGIIVEMKDVRVGPTVSQYSLKPANGVKLSAIDNVQRDLGLALATPHVRIEAPIHGQSLVGIEIPNPKKGEVTLKTIINNSIFFNSTEPLPVAVGQDVSGQNLVFSLAKMPHLLVAGATGSGKSVWINSMLLSLLSKYSPAQLGLILVDMKRVELKLYDGIPHLLAPVITEAEKAINALKWVVIEMDKRYKLLEQHGKRNIKDFNSSADSLELNKLPFIVVVIDELGDLMMLAKSEVEPIIVRLTQMSRAVGIHLVLGTQRPDTHVVTGLIKANVPSRIAFAVASQIDSRVILDQSGAEKLLGQGDGLFMNPQSIMPTRFQGPYVDDKEVKQFVMFLKEEGQRHSFSNLDYTITEPPKVKVVVPGMASSNQDDDTDDILEEARKLVVTHQKASASFLQQMLGIGYPKAARVIQQLEDLGIVGPQNGSKPRDVYITSETEDIL